MLVQPITKPFKSMTRSPSLDTSDLMSRGLLHLVIMQADCVATRSADAAARTIHPKTAQLHVLAVVADLDLAGRAS